jgi:Protein of unknown function (DUF2917)
MDAYRISADYTELTNLGLGHDSLARIEGRGVLLRVQYGSVWITQSGSSQDVYLKAGESFRIDRCGLTLVSTCGRSPLALITLTPSARFTPSLAKRVAIRFWNAWDELYRMLVRPSTDWFW